ncbi:MAG: chorismate synthase [Firmicutes bacterium]|jgi:chorismate synthase|nr:chorismate synthase [Bacillota bacterium]
MSGSSFGKNFVITTWGESHGKALGAVVDGCPAGIKLSENDIQKDLDRRKPGNSRYSTPRKESDRVQILSGVFEGKTTGTPISLLIPNADQRSSDYSQLSDLYRPGHADYVYDQKYGFRDYRGGGRSSGRETAARVAAGAIAKKVLAEFGIDVFAYTFAIGEYQLRNSIFDRQNLSYDELMMPDPEISAKAKAYLEEMTKNGDSVGGVVECIVQRLPAGVGEPVFEKLDAKLAQAIFSVGAVKAVEIGSGINCSKFTGSEHNDPLQYQDDRSALCLRKLTNNSGGIVGGISEGFPIKIRASFKPTPSIAMPQQSVSKAGENIELIVKGRHDPIIVPRAVVVVEAMTAITLVDYLFQRVLSRIDLLKLALKGNGYQEE